MTELLDDQGPSQVDTNPFAEEGRPSVGVLRWVIDERTKKPVARWKPMIKLASADPVITDNGIPSTAST